MEMGNLTQVLDYKQYADVTVLSLVTIMSMPICFSNFRAFETLICCCAAEFLIFILLANCIYFLSWILPHFIWNTSILYGCYSIISLGTQYNGCLWGCFEKKKKIKIRKTTNLQSCVFVKCIQVEFSANFWQGSKIKTIVFIQVLLKFSAVE